jgi:hypothetical protein
MAIAEVEDWFALYLDEFARLGRGDVADERRILAYYGVPLVFSTADGSKVLTDEGEVLAAAHRQVAGLRAADYARTEELSTTTVALNGSCTLRSSRFVRYARSGAEIARVAATYLITAQPGGLRITALVVHDTE